MLSLESTQWILQRQTESLARKAFSRAPIDRMRFSDPRSSSPSGKAGGLTGRAQAQPCRLWQTVVMWKRLSHFPLHFCPHRGHSPEWYNKGFGHLCAAEVARIRNSFQPLIAEGPETKIWVFPSVTSNSGKKKQKQTLVGESVSVRKQERERETDWQS